MNSFRTFDPCTLLAPVPAVMVSCACPEKDPRPNIITIAWAGTVNSDPPMVSVSVRKNRYSHALIRDVVEQLSGLMHDIRDGQKDLFLLGRDGDILRLGDGQAMHHAVLDARQAAV